MQANETPTDRSTAALERAAAYRAAGYWTDATLWHRAAEHARERPDALAVVDAGGEREHSYAELVSAARGIAGHLRAHGVAAGDVVSIQLPNQFEAVVAALAVQGLGAVINPLLPGYRLHELEQIVRVAEPRAMLTPIRYRGFDHRELVSDLRSRTGTDLWHVTVPTPGEPASDAVKGQVDFEEAAAGEPAAADSLGGDARTISEVIFTSGTEAAPKAVLHSEETTNFSVRTAYADMQLSASDVVWMPSPVGHSTGFNYGVRMALYHGLPLVLQDRWDSGTALALVDRFGCTYTLAATTFLQDLVDRARADERRLDSLRCFGCGGAPVPPDLVREARRFGVGVRRLYGSTEVLVATWNRMDASEQRLTDTDGAAMSNVEVEVRNESGERCGPGERGEIFVRGPNTCVGFLRDPEREHRTIDEAGWVRSGDLAVFDTDGYLSIVGRSKDIIIRGGLNIAPREVEDLLLGFPEVERAAIVGVPDPRLGERCCACLVLRDGAHLDLESIVTRLRESGLSTHKLPERLECFDSLPTTASGKIQKFKVLEALGALPGAGSSA